MRRNRSSCQASRSGSWWLRSSSIPGELGSLGLAVWWCLLTMAITAPNSRTTNQNKPTAYRGESCFVGYRFAIAAWSWLCTQWPCSSLASNW